uniref:Putative secreted protein n=1 Tax=Anopheles marajoara TaxID=58244 RepID=A0A2M4CCH6_9DIPT
MLGFTLVGPAVAVEVVLVRLARGLLLCREWMDTGGGGGLADIIEVYLALHQTLCQLLSINTGMGISGFLFTIRCGTF